MQRFSFRYTTMALALMCCGSLFAQDTANPSPDSASKVEAPSVHKDHEHHGFQHSFCPVHPHLAGILKHERSKLKLNAQQSSALDALIKDEADRFEKGRQSFHDMMMAHKKGESQTAVEMLDQHQKMMEDHLNDAKALIDEFKKFYASLQPEQQKIVDKAFAHPHPMMMGMEGKMEHWKHNHSHTGNQKPTEAAPVPAAEPSK